MLRHRVISLFLIVIFAGVVFFVYSPNRPFRLGLDLNGGTELTYRADISQVKGGDIGSAMSSLRDVIERRVNMFGVSEPVVQVENPGVISGNSEHRLLVELPGVTDIEEAIKLIGKTPQLEFILVRPEAKNFTEE